MRVCVIGGTGHVGSFLSTMLAEGGHQVTVASSGRTPIPSDGPWQSIDSVTIRYGAEGWLDVIRGTKPDAVVDILQGNSPALYDALKDTCGQFVVCGSLWMLGRPRVVPTPAVTQAPCLFEGYASRYAQMLQTKERAKAEGIAFTAVMPPNICGPGKIPLEGHGGRDLEVHKAHRRGERVFLPAPGNNLVGPCDAEDIARAFMLSIENPEGAADCIFNVGSTHALTAVQFVETYGDIYGSTIPVELVDWSRYETEMFPEIGANWHFQANMCPDIRPLQERLGYQPAYTPEQTMERAVRWMFDEGLFDA